MHNTSEVKRVSALRVRFRINIGSGALAPQKAKIRLLLLSKLIGGTKVPLPKIANIKERE